MNLEDMNTFQFMEELQHSFLYLENRIYIPVGITSKAYRILSPAVLSSIYITSKDICKLFANHTEDVLSTVLRYGSCEQYVYFLGYYLFEKNKFSWKYFRVFLALICELSTLTYKKGMALMTDDFIITTATYLHCKLLHFIEFLGGWKAFYLDCSRIVLKMKLYDLQNNKHSSMAMSSSQQLKMMKMRELFSCSIDLTPTNEKYFFQPVIGHYNEPSRNMYDLNSERDSYEKSFNTTSMPLKNYNYFVKVATSYNNNDQSRSFNNSFINYYNQPKVMEVLDISYAKNVVPVRQKFMEQQDFQPLMQPSCGTYPVISIPELDIHTNAYGEGFHTMAKILQNDNMFGTTSVSQMDNGQNVYFNEQEVRRMIHFLSSSKDVTPINEYFTEQHPLKNIYNTYPESYLPNTKLDKNIDTNTYEDDTMSLPFQSYNNSGTFSEPFKASNQSMDFSDSISNYSEQPEVNRVVNIYPCLTNVTPNIDRIAYQCASQPLEESYSSYPTFNSPRVDFNTAENFCIIRSNEQVKVMKTAIASSSKDIIPTSESPVGNSSKIAYKGDNKTPSPFQNNSYPESVFRSHIVNDQNVHFNNNIMNEYEQLKEVRMTNFHCSSNYVTPMNESFADMPSKNAYEENNETPLILKSNDYSEAVLWPLMDNDQNVYLNDGIIKDYNQNKETVMTHFPCNSKCATSVNESFAYVSSKNVYQGDNKPFMFQSNDYSEAVLRPHKFNDQNMQFKDDIIKVCERQKTMTNFPCSSEYVAPIKESFAEIPSNKAYECDNKTLLILQRNNYSEAVQRSHIVNDENMYFSDDTGKSYEHLKEKRTTYFPCSSKYATPSKESFTEKSSLQPLVESYTIQPTIKIPQLGMGSTHVGGYPTATMILQSYDNFETASTFHKTIDPTNDNANQNQQLRQIKMENLYSCPRMAFPVDTKFTQVNASQPADNGYNAPFNVTNFQPGFSLKENTYAGYYGTKSKFLSKGDNVQYASSSYQVSSEPAYYDTVTENKYVVDNHFTITYVINISTRVLNDMQSKIETSVPSEYSC